MRSGEIINQKCFLCMKLRKILKSFYHHFMDQVIHAAFSSSKFQAYFGCNLNIIPHLLHLLGFEPSTLRIVICNCVRLCLLSLSSTQAAQLWKRSKTNNLRQAVMSFPHHLIPEEIKSTWKEMELNQGLRAPEMNSLTSRLWLLRHNYVGGLVY